MIPDMDIETLLSLIRKYPELYVTKNRDGKDLYKKEMAWRKIQETTGLDVHVMKTKWKSLRDTYIKHKKSKCEQSLPHVRKLSNWIWADRMAFLDSSIVINHNENEINVSPSTSTNIPTETDDNSECNTSKEKHKQVKKVTKRNNWYDNDYAKKKAKKPKNNHTQKPPAPVENLVNIECDRLDMEFLGYASTVKKFSLNKQAVVKLQITNIITQAQLQDSGEGPSDNASCSYTLQFEEPSLKPGNDLKIEFIDDPLLERRSTVDDDSDSD